MVSEEEKKAIENIKRDINLAKEGEGFETEVLCDAIDLQTLLRLIQNSIPKSLVEEKIEEIDKMIEKINKGELQRYTVGELLLIKRVLEELLKGDE